MVALGLPALRQDITENDVLALLRFVVVGDPDLLRFEGFDYRRTFKFHSCIQQVYIV